MSEVKATVIPLELALGIPAENPVMKLLNGIMGMMVRIMPGLFAYQYVFVLQVADRTVNTGTHAP